MGFPLDILYPIRHHTYMTNATTYTAELLPNGYVRTDCRQTGLVRLWQRDPKNWRGVSVRHGQGRPYGTEQATVAELLGV